LPFSAGEFERRLRAVRASAAARRLDGLVLNSPENLYYLSGYQSLGYFAYQVLVVPVDAEPCFVVRYGERTNLWGRSWIQNLALWHDIEDPITVTKEVIERSRLRRVGIELQSWFFPPAMHQRLLGAVSDVAFEDCTGLVEGHRVVKSAEELRYVRAAAQVSVAAVTAGIQAVGSATHDLDVAAAVYAAMIRAGGEYPPLPPLVAVGWDTTLFHNTWSGRPVRPGDVIELEIPGVVGRYMAAVSRTTVRGEPPAYVVERHQMAVESLEAGHGAMKPGVSCAEVYEAFARPYLKAGYEVPSKPAYPLGISFPPRWIEEGPYVLPGNPTPLQPGMVFHTPRTVRVYGDQTPIISETVLITEMGTEVLTTGLERIVFRC
jgi:Xaa-Pro dipeptidase